MGCVRAWAAERFPRCRIFALSNSQAQRAYIEAQASHLRLADRLHVSTGDVSTFRARPALRSRSLDRDVRAHAQRRSPARSDRRWLTPTGRLFVHQFCHREHAYFYETEGADDWMGRTFFTGGMMPSDDLLLNFQRPSFSRTGGASAASLPAHPGDLARQPRSRRRGTSDPEPQSRQASAALWLQRWRLFLMACSELFAYGQGNEWYVATIASHHADASAVPRRGVRVRRFHRRRYQDAQLTQGAHADLNRAMLEEDPGLVVSPGPADSLERGAPRTVEDRRQTLAGEIQGLEQSPRGCAAPASGDR